MFIRNILNVLQIFINIIYIYFILVFYNKMSKHFQTTLPGMFFPGIFFSLQYNMFTDIHDNFNTLL